MFHTILSTISESFSGPAAKEHVAEIIRYHRIQASPGFRQAAAYCHQVLAAGGLQVQTLRFPGDGKTFYWTCLMPQEWEVTAAELWLIPPEGPRRKLADFRECKISLIQRSDPTPPEGLEAQVIALDDGTEEEHYQGLDVTGKIVLTNSSDLARLRELAVERHGAIGILYDGMMETPPVRTRLDVPDARQYLSFWPTGQETKPCFGFVLSPRLGDELRQLLKKEPNKPVKVWARVEARFIPDGHIEVVSALIPGQTDDEVLVIAHLCHPQPSANDNASGAGAVLEVAQTLQRLIVQGKLAPPRRGIRFLLVPEMTGTYAYLATHPEHLGKMLAAINLDMVGQDQDLCGSVFLLEELPHAMPSFVNDLAARIREELTNEAKTWGGAGGYALFRHAIAPFSGGSDHYILSDPTVGVPCPMIIQWPDRFYHTSQDTLDKVDPASLYRAGVLAATYAYFLANAHTQEATWLGREMLTRFKGRLATIVQETVTKAMTKTQGEALAEVMADLRRKTAYYLEREGLALASLRRISPQVDVTGLHKEAAAFAEREMADGEAAIRAYAASLGITEIPSPLQRVPDQWETQAAGIVPARVFPGPVELRGFLLRLTPQEREEWYHYAKEHRQEVRHMAVLALYWADGKRNLLEIADAIDRDRQTERGVFGAIL